MIKLYTPEEFENANSRDLLSLECCHCHLSFKVPKKDIHWKLKCNYRNALQYCSKMCRGKHDTELNTKEINCSQCDKKIRRGKSTIKTNNFCSSSCAATYNNTHKTKGTRKSKLECWLETKIKPLYPSLEFHFNRKDAINSELDIYIPSLKLAFELNGIFHYEPIYGVDRLKSIKNNDTRKFQACIERGIELCIIDSSKQMQFKEKTSGKYLDIITNVINDKLKADC